MSKTATIEKVKAFWREGGLWQPRFEVPCGWPAASGSVASSYLPAVKGLRRGPARAGPFSGDAGAICRRHLILHAGTFSGRLTSMSLAKVS